MLVALCRPAQGVDRFDAPATNQQIADELYLTVAAVKTHLRALSQRFGTHGPAAERQARAARQMAFELELVTRADFLEAS